MSAFDKIIGYGVIKKELESLVDMIRNKEVYEKLGAKLPQGILISGEPGLGKTLMAKCFIEECGLSSYTIRRNKKEDDFVEEITEVFHKAKNNSPVIVFLDDLCKFSNQDYYHKNTAEYVAVQAGIDDVRGTGVFVIATANDVDKLPDSLVRVGRFDRKIIVKTPSPADAREIMEHYLKDKNLSADVNFEDIAAMINYSSCATLESVLNEAAINAAYARRSSVTMEDFINAVIRMEYESPDDTTTLSDEKLHRIALHEAGHAVLSEVLYPECVGLASLQVSGRNSTRGFVKRCVEIESTFHLALIALAGKTAVDLYYADGSDTGAKTDLEDAIELIRNEISTQGTLGLAFVDPESRNSPGMSEALNVRSEAVVYAELERYMSKTREILMKNRDFLEKIAEALLNKQTLVKSDIKVLRESLNYNE